MDDSRGEGDFCSARLACNSSKRNPSCSICHPLSQTCAELHPPQFGDQQLQMLAPPARRQRLALPKNLLLLLGESIVLAQDEGSECLGIKLSQIG